VGVGTGSASKNFKPLKLIISKVSDKSRAGSAFGKHNLYFFGRAALLRRPNIQGGAAAPPYREGEDSCHAPVNVAARFSILAQLQAQVVIDDAGTEVAGGGR